MARREGEVWRVLVIGAQGVLGSFIARRFREAGWAVTRGGPGAPPHRGVFGVDELLKLRQILPALERHGIRANVL